MSATLREYEDIQWFIFRYSGIKALPYSELGTHHMGSADRQLYHEALRLKTLATAGKCSTGKHVANVAFPRMISQGGQGFMHGPKSFESLPDTPLYRAKLYIQLVAYLADFPKEKEQVELRLWLPPTLSSINEEREKKYRGKYQYKPLKAEDFKPLEMTPALLLVDYNWKFVEDWLAYAGRHPDYCMTPEWEYRNIDYSK